MTSMNNEARTQRVLCLITSRRYLLLSILATGIAISHAAQVLLQREQRKSVTMDMSKSTEEIDSLKINVPFVLTFRELAYEVMNTRTSAVITMHFFLAMMYHAFLYISQLFFCQVRLNELRQAKETVVHLLFMRFLQLVSTMGPNVEQPKVFIALLWLGFVVFQHGLLSLCKARFHNLLNRPSAHQQELDRLGYSLLAIIAVDLLSAYASSYLPFVTPFMIRFAWFEAALLLVKALQLGTKFVFHMIDVGNFDEMRGIFGTERGEFYLLILQTVLSSAYLLQLIAYYMNILGMDQFRVSILDFVLILNMKHAVLEVMERVAKVKLYHRVVLTLDELFPDATEEELKAVADDVCVICLKPMDVHAKKLDCGHLFHRFCIRQCLQKASIGDSFSAMQQRTTINPIEAILNTGPGDSETSSSTLRCPMCRQHVRSRLKKPKSIASPLALPPTVLPTTTEQLDEVEPMRVPGVLSQTVADENRPPPAVPNDEAIIRFSTGFLSRWLPLPNFSFEVIRHRDLQEHNGLNTDIRRRDAPFTATWGATVTPQMIQSVWEILPQFSLDEIGRDLQLTRSPDRTIERLLNNQAARNAHDEFSHENEIGNHFYELGELWSTIWQPDTSTQRQQQNESQALNSPDFLREPLNLPNDNNPHERRVLQTESLLARLQRWRARMRAPST